MRCAQVQELFSEIYDGIAEAGAAGHLLDCPACAAEYKRYSRLLDELRQLPEPELPAGFHEAMMDKIREIALSDKAAPHELKVITGNRKNAAPTRQATKKAASISRRWAGVAAAACVLLISLWAVRVFDMPGVRFADDSAAYNMMLPQAADAATDMAMPPTDFIAPGMAMADADFAYDCDAGFSAEYGTPEFEPFTAVDAAHEPADEPATEGMFDAVPPQLDYQHVAQEDEADEILYRDDYAPEIAPQEISAGAAPPDDDTLWVDLSEEYEGEWDDAASRITGGAGVEEYRRTDSAEAEPLELQWHIEYQDRESRDRDYPATQDMIVMERTEASLREHGREEIFVVLELTADEGLSPWDIAFAVGIIILCIATGAMLWNVYKNKAKERLNR